MDQIQIRLQNIDDAILKLQQELASLKVHMKRKETYIDADLSENSEINQTDADHSDDECDDFSDGPDA